MCSYTTAIVLDKVPRGSSACAWKLRHAFSPGQTDSPWVFEDALRPSICQLKQRGEVGTSRFHVSKIFGWQKNKKRWIRTASNFIDLIQFQLIWRNFVEVNPKGPCLSLEKQTDNFCVLFTDSIKRGCEIRNFHVSRVQRRQTNVQNSVIHGQICCFVNKNLLLFCRSLSVAVVVGQVCCHAEIVLPW